MKALNDAGRPLSLPELCSRLGVAGGQPARRVLERLNALVRRGSVTRNRRNRFALPDRADAVSERRDGVRVTPGMEAETAIRAHGIPWEWPAEALARAEDPTLVGKPQDRVRLEPGPRRRDLRELPFVTIDGVDARDFDDAVYARPEAGGWRALVAIADVSHYVRPDDALDRCAAIRGNSVYFPDRVIPMLPERLSNDVCSLNPDADRLALVCEMHLAADGETRRYRFFEAVIRSRARLTYERAQRLLDDATPRAARPCADVMASLGCLHALSRVLWERRVACGSLDLEIAEPRFHFDANGRIRHVGSRARLQSHRLIEECMLAANVCAARLIEGRSRIGMYRVHERPDADKIADLAKVYHAFGIDLGGPRPGGKDLMAAVRAARERCPKAAQTLQVAVLRAMKQASYSATPAPHYALDFELYTHFTSPIRRYPDLVVHRLIKDALSSNEKARRRTAALAPDRDALQGIAERCSMTERRAEEAVRDVYRWLKAEYMQAHVGEVYEGRISGIVPFGAFVTLDDVYIDGLVHVSALGNDYYRFDPAALTLNGERSGRVFRLGDAMTVRVAAVDLDEAKIDFVPVKGGALTRKSRKWSKIESWEAS